MNLESLIIRREDFSQGKYLAYQLSASARESLVEAIGAHFEVRVCHHITLHHADVVEDSTVERLQQYIDNHFGGFLAVGYMVTANQVVVKVLGPGRFPGKPIPDLVNIENNFLHITYERERAVKNSDSKSVFTDTIEYRFVPILAELTGEFKMLERGNTPTEIQSQFSHASKAGI